jgi:hypothetical protein
VEIHAEDAGGRGIDGDRDGYPKVHKSLPPTPTPPSWQAEPASAVETSPTLPAWFEADAACLIRLAGNCQVAVVRAHYAPKRDDFAPRKRFAESRWARARADETSRRASKTINAAPKRGMSQQEGNELPMLRGSGTIQL